MMTTVTSIASARRPPMATSSISDQDLILGIATGDAPSTELALAEQAVRLHRLADTMLTRAEQSDNGGHPERIREYLSVAFQSMREFRSSISTLSALRSRRHLYVSGAELVEAGSAVDRCPQNGLVPRLRKAPVPV